MDCGAYEFELDHYKKHTYKEYELFFGLRLILCDFCDVDFGSYHPSHFGFTNGKRSGYGDFNFVREIPDKSLRIDKYCPDCKQRLPFLKFIAKCREINERTTY